MIEAARASAGVYPSASALGSGSSRRKLVALSAAIVVVEIAAARAVLDLKTLAVLGALLTVAMVVVKPAFGLGVFLAVIPWLYPFREDFGGPAASPVRALAVLLVLVSLLYIVMGKRAPTSALAIPALVFAAFLTLSYRFQDVHYPYDASSQIDVVLVPLGLALPFLAFPLTRREMSLIAAAFSASVVVLAGFGIHEHYTASNLWQDEFYVPLLRVAGPFPHPLVFASVLACGAMVLVEAVLRARRRSLRLVAAGSLCLVLLAFIFTYSRGPAVALVVGLAYLLLRGRFIWALKAEWILLTAFLGAVVARALQSETVMERANSTETLEIRLALYRLAWKLFQENWLYGLGVRGFAHEVGSVVSSVPENFVNIAHWWAIDNYFLTALVEGGMLGGAAFLALLAVALRLVWTSSATDPLQRIGVSFLLVLFIVSIDIDSFHYPFIAALFFFGMRLAASRRRAEVRF